MKEKIKSLLKPKIKLVKGTRFVSFCFLFLSVLIAAAIVWGANMYYDIDAGKIIIEEVTKIQNKLLELTGGLKITGGTTEITNSAGAVTIQPAGEVKISPTGTVAVNITAGAASTWKTTAGQLDIKTEGAGNNLVITSAGALTEAFAASSDYQLKRGTEPILSINTDGAVTLQARGTNQTITLLPSGTGRLYLASTTDYYITPEGELRIKDLYTGGTQRIDNAGNLINISNITLSGDIQMANTHWIGLGSAAGRIIFTDATPDTVTIANADLLFNGAAKIDAAGTLTVEFSTSTGGFILQSESPVVKYLEINSDGTLTLRSGGSANLVLDAASGKVEIASGDTVYVDNIAIGGEGKIVGIVPIFGFDLPAQTASTSFVRVSRTLENYPFSATTTGTKRVHKLAIRYADNLPSASTTNWRVSTTTGAAFSTFDLPGCNSTTTAGRAYLATTTIPTDGTDWWLEVKSQEPYPNYPIRIFQIFLVAFDVKQ